MNNIFWPWLTMAPIQRPSRLIPEDQKDENYDDRCALWCLGSVNQPSRDFYVREYAANHAMTVNAQGSSSWGNDQQIRELLGDENNPTGRQAWRYAIFQPIHTRLVGSTSGISISAKAVSWTSNLAARLDTALYEQLLMSQAAATGGTMQEAMASKGISPDEDEQEAKFRNLWTDPYERTVTNLITGMGKRQKLRQMQKKVSSHLALSGVAAIKFFSNGNNIEAELCEPNEVGWDPAATRADFSDGAYCYHSYLSDVSSIAERFQPSKAKIMALDAWANMQGGALLNGCANGWQQGKPRIMETYFKDMKYIERGFVLKDGAPHYCTINEPDPASKDGKPLYTDNDLIPPPENEWTVTWTPKEWREKKQSKQIQYLRFCTMIPWQYLPGNFTGGLPFEQRKSQFKKDDLTLISPTGNLILDSGVYTLQETDPDDKYLVEFPIKFASWMYLGSLAIAPMSCVRDIQGVMNATLSDMMMRMSRAPMPTVVFDEAALTAAGVSVDEAARNVKIGKSFGVKGAIVGSIQNAIKEISIGLGPDFYQRFNILDQLYAMGQNATGVFAQNYGAPEQDQLVRVKEMQTRQAGLMLQPFNSAFEDVFQQAHQFNAQAGRRFFCSRQWLLNELVGDEGERIMLLSKDMDAEQFRVEIVSTASPEQRKEDARNMILAQGGYVDRQFLDAKTATELLASGALPEDVDDAAARFTKRMAEAQKMQAPKMEQQQTQQMALQARAHIDEQEKELGDQAIDVGLKQEAMQRKSMQPHVQALSEWNKPQEQDFVHEQQGAEA